MSRKIEISHRTIVFSILFLGFVWVLVKILSIILGIFVAVLLMTALNPIVERLVRMRVPRGIAIIFSYVLLLVVVGLALSGIIPPLAAQTATLIERLPQTFDSLGVWLAQFGITGVDGNIVSGQISRLSSIPADLLRFFAKLLSNIVAVFSVLIITFYLLLERQRLDKYLTVLFGAGEEQRARRFVDQLEVKLGGWVRGEIMLMVIIGVATYIGLLLLGIPFALPLAILAGLFEIIPGIGPILSSAPAVIAGFTVSPVIGLATVALCFLIQQFENALIVPKVLQKATGVNPLVTIIALAVGLQLGGPMGAILAVPIVVVIQVVAVEFSSSKRLQ